MIYNPANDELYIAERGKGAFLNDQRLRVAGRRRLDECVIACGLPHIGRGDHELALQEMAALQNKVAGLRRFGAASLDLAFVAAGRLDGYWERNLQPWDIAAGQIMVREAGGTISGIEGSDDPLKTGHVICGNEYRARGIGEDTEAAATSRATVPSRAPSHHPRSGDAAFRRRRKDTEEPRRSQPKY